jgi:small subunit ribosomal protein S1
VVPTGLTDLDVSDDQNGAFAASLEDYLNQEEVSSKPLAHGDIIDGVVVRVDPDEVLVDVGSKSEGVISGRELGPRGEPGAVELQSGDRIKVFVLQPENEDGNVVLSLRRARAESVWLKAQEKQGSGELIEAEVREQNKGGLIVNVMGLRGFLPTSQVSRSYAQNLQELVGQRIGVKVLEVNRKRNRLIVSQKAAYDEDRARQRTELFDRLRVGDEVKGRVSGLTTYGAFVNLGAADGLIHISELSWDRVANVADVLQVGQDVNVKVIKLDPDLSRISLSLRQLGDDPWEQIEKRYPPGAVVEGEVTKIKKYGAFLQIGDGVEGLLHISELAWEHVERTEDVVQVGQHLRVKVLQADRSRRRISLSLKQVEERPEFVPADSAHEYPDEVEDEEPAPAREPAYAHYSASAAPQD